MKEWQIELNGNEADLDLLCKIFTTRDLNVRKDGDSYYLVSSDFNPPSDPIKIFEEVTPLIDIINGIAKLYYEKYQSVQIKLVSGVDDKGERTSYVLLTAPQRDCVLTALGGPEDLPKKILSLSNTDESVARALTLFGSFDHNWRTLSLVLDVIEENAGGQSKLVKQDWAPKGIVRFKKTVNDFLTLGKDARHAKVSRKPITNPIPLQDAKILINRLLWAWIKSKMS